MGAAELRVGPGAGGGVSVAIANSLRWLCIVGMAALATVILFVVSVPVLSTHITCTNLASDHAVTRDQMDTKR